MTEQVLAVLVEDRRRSIAHDLASARRVPLRRRLAAFVYAVAKAVTILGVILDDEPGTARA